MAIGVGVGVGVDVTTSLRISAHHPLEWLHGSNDEQYGQQS